MRAALPLAAALGLLSACAPAAPGPRARAFRAERPDQLVGGDLAMGRVGDFILENDQIRVAVLAAESSPAPGVFGGTLVDADLQRPEDRFRGGTGADQLAEVIPVANLLWPRPADGDVTIVADGSDGGPAIVRVTGDGGVFLEALSLLRGDLVSLLFPGVRFDLRIQTDYILAPGARHVRMVSTAFAPDGDPANPLPLPSPQGALPVFGAILGDEASGLAPGLMAGDFLFFGGRNDIFAPGLGFDEEKPIFDALFAGRDTFTHPLAFDFVAAPGGDVSYAYFNPATGGDPKVLVPIITSSSTGFITAALNCKTDPSDDATCDRHAAWRWERYLAVGDGDVASVADVVHAVRGLPTGAVTGVVLGPNGNALPNARIFVMADPGPDVPLTVEALAAAHVAATGQVGLVNAIDADPGRDPIEDGAFKATLPPGDYVLFAQNAARTATGAPVRVRIAAGETARVAPRVPLPARVRVRVHDAGGAGVDAKLSFVALDADGRPLEGDGLRRPWLGESRIGNGIRHQASALRGEATVELEPGRYALHASRGPEWSKAVVNLDLTSGEERALDLALAHEVDTRGWISGDFHLHAEASFDSGLPFTERLRRVLVEGLDLAVATDHDVVSDYGPAARALGAEDRLKTGVGVELSTLELGHFIAFPLAHDDRDRPTHGAPDWSCLDGPSIMSDLKDFIEDPGGGVRIMAHPRDGFFGHISQIGLDALGGSRALSTLEANNPLLARTSCDFDAMELLNGKRLDLVRTPTNAEVIRFNRCVSALEAAPDRAALDAACPELSSGGPLADCPADLPLADCKGRLRRRAAFLVARDILIRTPEEQVASWHHDPDAEADAPRCDPAGAGLASDAGLPCVHWTGTYDDWMRWLDGGLAVTLTGASDSHGSEREPGWPRTWVRSDAPTAPAIDVASVAQRVAGGEALASFGPFVEVSVGGHGPGAIASVAAGEGADFTLDLRVQTASWFGVDRLEIYVSGLLERVITLDHGPETIVDFDGTISLPVPAADGFVSVVAIGTREDNLLGPVVTDVPFGELQLPRVAALAFSAIPAFSLVFTPTPAVPDFFPIFPLAATNAIFLDVDGDGRWTPPGPRPVFCERTCDPAAPSPEAACEPGEVCLPDGVCGLAIEASCQTGAPGSEDRYLHLHD